MLANDTLGDCTIAAVGHAVQTWTANASKEATVNDAIAIEYYEKWDGYNPNDPETDQGGVELSVLKDWQKQGFNGTPLKAFAEVNPLNVYHVKATIALFGGIYIGVELPLTAQDQNIWQLDPNASTNASAPGSWGGHALWVPTYDVNTLTCITWGAPKQMTWDWFQKYCSESYALFSPAFLGTSGVAPSGLNMTALLSDLAQVQD
jgi:hypothetical protein